MSIRDGKIEDNNIVIIATKIKMKPGCATSASVWEIREIYLLGGGFNGFYTKEYVHDLVKNGNTVNVNIAPYPELIPAVSSRGEKCVRSAPDEIEQDNLLKLPRE